MLYAKAALAIALTLSFVMPSFAATTDPVFGAVDSNAPGCAAARCGAARLCFPGLTGWRIRSTRYLLTGGLAVQHGVGVQAVHRFHRVANGTGRVAEVERSGAEIHS